MAEYQQTCPRVHASPPETRGNSGDSGVLQALAAMGAESGGRVTSWFW